MKTPTILLVEDNDADVELTQHALRRQESAPDLVSVGTGQDALDFLRRRGAYQNAPRPGLILLDINLPGMDGHEILDAIKSDPSLSTIPVVMLSSSPRTSDVHRALAGHANSYVVKPVNFKDFVSAMGDLSSYWLELVEPAPVAA